MTLSIHLGPRIFGGPLLRRPHPTAVEMPRGGDVAETGEQPAIDPRIYAVQRLGAVGVGLVLLAFGILGATGGVGFLTTHGGRYLGMSSNGLLSTLSLVVAVVLLSAAVRGPRTASTLMIALGGLFLVSALLNLALLRTPYNVLAFRMSNVVFSVAVGLLLLFLGAYGRISGNLPANSPYAHPHPAADEPPDLPSTPQELAAEAAMREAEIAVAQHYATEDQRRRVLAMSRVHTRDDRRRVWLQHDAAPMPTAPDPVQVGSRR